MERSARVSDSWKKEKKKQLVVFQRVQCTDINFYSLARKCVNRRHSDIVITIVPRRNLKIYHYVNSFQDRDFSKFGTRCSKSGRNSSIDPPTIPFSRVIYSTKFRSTCQMQRIDQSLESNSSPSLPNSKCIGSIHCGPTTHADKGRQYRPLRRFQLPSPIMDPLLVITVASSLTNNTVPKYTDGFRNRGLSRRARVRETCSRQFDTNSRRKNRKKKKRKSKKKRSINQRNVSTRMHRCTRSLRGNKQANIKISRGWNGKRE